MGVILVVVINVSFGPFQKGEAYSNKKNSICNDDKYDYYFSNIQCICTQIKENKNILVRQLFYMNFLSVHRRKNV